MSIFSGLFKNNSAKQDNSLSDWHEREFYVLWRKTWNIPVFDLKRRLRVYTDKTFFEKKYAIIKPDIWGLPIKEIELKLMSNDKSFFGSLYYQWGCEEILINDMLSQPTLSMTEVVDSFNKSKQGHEVANPKFRMTTIIFNTLLEMGEETQAASLLKEYMELLRDAELLIPATSIESGMQAVRSCTIYGEEALLVYSDFEAVPKKLREDGYTNGLVVRMSDLIDTAISENKLIAINKGSPGGGVLLVLTDILTFKYGHDTVEIYNKAEEYRLNGDMSKAVKLYHEVAEKGFYPAQNNLGVYYQSAETPDMEKAIYWYEKAAEFYASAAFTLGRIYDIDANVPQDLEKAAKYYQKAADLGDPQGMYNLASMYLSGQGVEHDGLKGVSLLEQAAKKGMPEAVSALAKLKEKIKE